MIRKFTIAFALMFAFASQAMADGCNCSRHVAACSAQGNLDGETLTLRADTNQCAQITYDINGDPDSMTIRGGVGTNTIPILNPGRRRDLHVNSCDVCADAEQSSQPRLPECVRSARGCADSRARLDWCVAKYPTIPRCGNGDSIRTADDAYRNTACQKTVQADVMNCLLQP